VIQGWGSNNFLIWRLRNIAYIYPCIVCGVDGSRDASPGLHQSSRARTPDRIILSYDGVFQLSEFSCHLGFYSTGQYRITHPCSLNKSDAKVGSLAHFIQSLVNLVPVITARKLTTDFSRLRKGGPYTSGNV
jgi:hypothetical protein